MKPRSRHPKIGLQAFTGTNRTGKGPGVMYSGSEWGFIISASTGRSYAGLGWYFKKPHRWLEYTVWFPRSAR